MFLPTFWNSNLPPSSWQRKLIQVDAGQSFKPILLMKSEEQQQQQQQQQKPCKNYKSFEVLIMVKGKVIPLQARCGPEGG